MVDINKNADAGFRDPRSAVSVLNNGVPLEVRVFQAPTENDTRMRSAGLYVNDTWVPNPRVSLNLGLRLDRLMPYMPVQSGPGGQSFPAVNPIVTWWDLGPRLGVTYDITGRGKTVVKANSATYWPNLGSALASYVSANPQFWFKRYTWPTDLNSNGVWDPGEETRLIQTSGGQAFTAFDRQLESNFTRQVSAFLEHELRASFGIRTGLVWNGERHIFNQVNPNRPLDAYSVPVFVQDPGPDGRAGTAERWTDDRRIQPVRECARLAGREPDRQSAGCQKRLLHLGDDRDQATGTGVVDDRKFRRDVGA